jgi:CRP/FNR family putative post-exponential-phase nitrogen-starvation transcriptional regulator
MSVAICKDDLLYIEEIRTSKLTEIATLLGTSYRHLNRVIDKLIARKIIRKEKRAIIIENIKALKELSRGNLYE